MRNITLLFVPALLSMLVLFPHTVLSQNPAPDRGQDEGIGPFETLVVRGAILIDGTGAPPRGPVDIVIKRNRIESILSAGTPGIPLEDGREPLNADYELDAEGMYIMPGFVNLHTHAGGRKAPETEYVYKLWLAHGITTVRGVALGGMEWTLNERERSARNEISAPRIVAYQRPGSGNEWSKRSIRTEEDAREWVRYAARKSIDGMKLVAFRPEIMAALLDEAQKLKLGSTAHLAQTGVAQMNALDAARLGLGSLTHFYGLFETLYKDHDVQPWPADMNYSNEQFRFAQVARQWDLIHPQGSKEWDALLQEFLDLDFILDPTMTAYLANRDLMRARNADWHRSYALPSLWEFYEPNRTDHGSYWYYWTTSDEIAWKSFFRIWMAFLDDYKDMGGRVTVSEDAAYLYSQWGFATIEEMELLQEAGFHPLEVIRSATMYGAEAIFEPKGRPIEYGVVREGLLADLVVIDENPLANLKVLYGTGWLRLNDDTRKVERVGGINYTIKDGILYDAKQLLADVEGMVKKAKEEMINGQVP